MQKKSRSSAVITPSPQLQNVRSRSCVFATSAVAIAAILVFLLLGATRDRYAAVSLVRPVPEARMFSVQHRIGTSRDSRIFQAFLRAASADELVAHMWQLGSSLYDAVALFEDEDSSALILSHNISALKASVETLLLHTESCVALIQDAPRRKTCGEVLSCLLPSHAPTDSSKASHDAASVWAITIGSVFARGIALADYERLLDSDAGHTKHVAGAVGLLATMLDMFGDSQASACRDIDFASLSQDGQWVSRIPQVVYEGVSDQSLAHAPLSPFANFVVSTGLSLMHLRRRLAAMLEELIALHPSYAPLRLHYAAFLVLDMQREADSSTRSFIDKELEALAAGKREGVDNAHRSVLELLEGYATVSWYADRKGDEPNDALRRKLNAAAQRAARAASQLVERSATAECDAVVLAPFSLEEHAAWSSRLGHSPRPMLMSKPSVQKMLARLKAALGEGQTAERSALKALAEHCSI